MFLEACPLNLAPTSSTTLTLAVGDAIAMSVMVKNSIPIILHNLILVDL